MKTIKCVIAGLISLLPFNWMRVVAYKIVFRYKIKKTRIGFGSVILVKYADLTACRIGKFCMFLGPMKIVIGQHSSIGSFNNFNCGSWTSNRESSGADYKQSLIIGEDVMITSHHFFDVAGSLNISSKTWIAGRSSQFWTHGAGVNDRNISIGKACYIASSVRFSPGSAISDNTIVAMGTVVTRKFNQPNVMIGGVPANIIKNDYHWKHRSHSGPSSDAGR